MEGGIGGGQILTGIVCNPELAKNVMNQTLMESENNNISPSGKQIVCSMMAPVKALFQVRLDQAEISDW